MKAFQTSIALLWLCQFKRERKRHIVKEKKISENTFFFKGESVRVNERSNSGKIL